MLTRRRSMLGGLTIGPALLQQTAAAAEPDGHAAGFDAVPAPGGLALIPRKTGEATGFTAALDRAPLKATSGGWAREVTARTLPIATGLALAHLFLNPGGSREMHWHNAAEWAFALGGRCQVTVVDADGACEVVNLGPGDLWYFPRGHAHAIQTIGDTPFHALLAFDDGLYSEHGTFGLSDWMSRLDPALLAQATGLSAEILAATPRGETYIMQGEVIAADGPRAGAERALPPDRSHRFALMAQAPWSQTPGGTMHVADSRTFPVATAIAGTVIRLRPRAMQHLHWHPTGDEFLYVARGSAAVSLFEAEKRLAEATVSAGMCAYVPANCGHMVRNVGDGPCEIVSVLNAPVYAEATVTDWLAQAPRHLLANNMGVPEAALSAFNRPGKLIAAEG
jgi:oxalate decarboxylase